MANDEEPWGCVLRLFWIIAGPIILLLISIKLVSSVRALSAIDLAFWSTAIMVVVAVGDAMPTTGFRSHGNLFRGEASTAAGEDEGEFARP